MLISQFLPDYEMHENVPLRYDLLRNLSMEIVRHRPELVRHRPEIVRHRPEIVKHRPEIVRHRALSAGVCLIISYLFLTISGLRLRNCLVRPCLAISRLSN